MITVNGSLLSSRMEEMQAGLKLTRGRQGDTRIRHAGSWKSRDSLLGFLAQEAVVWRKGIEVENFRMTEDTMEGDQDATLTVKRHEGACKQAIGLFASRRGRSTLPRATI